MSGRKQDSIWLYFDRANSSTKATCKTCGKLMHGIVARMKQHKLHCGERLLLYLNVINTDKVRYYII